MRNPPGLLTKLRSKSPVDFGIAHSSSYGHLYGDSSITVILPGRITIIIIGNYSQHSQKTFICFLNLYLTIIVALNFKSGTSISQSIHAKQKLRHPLQSVLRKITLAKTAVIGKTYC